MAGKGACSLAVMMALMIAVPLSAHGQGGIVDPSGPNLSGPDSGVLTGQVSIDSDYRFRGISIDHGQPAAHLDLAWDAGGSTGGGAYAGASFIASQNRQGGLSGLGMLGYAGYVWRPATGPAWEGGVSARHFRDDYSYDYDEVYAGLLMQNFTARVSWSPHGIGRRGQTLYSEVDSGAHLSAHWRTFVHAGVLSALSGPRTRTRYDVRTGLAANFGDYEIQAALSQTNPVPAYGSHEADDGTALVVSVSRFF